MVFSRWTRSSPARRRSFTMPLTPYSVSKGSVSRKAKSRVPRPQERKRATPMATRIRRMQRPRPAAAFCVRGKRPASLTKLRPMRATGLHTQRRVARAIFGAASRRRARYAEASARVTRRRAGVSGAGSGDSASSSSFSRKSVLTPKRRLICKIFSRSGRDWAPSHLETDCRVTSSCSASSSWDQPAFFRSCMILSARIIRIHSYPRRPLGPGAVFWRYGSGSRGCVPESRAGNLSTGGCGGGFFGQEKSG